MKASWCCAVLFLWVTAGLAQTAVPPQYFGMHLVNSQPWPTVPFGSLRLWDTDTRWQQMNPDNGVYDFSNLDAYLVLAKAHGIRDVVLVLSGTPQWASSDPANSTCDYAVFAAGSCAPPADLRADGTGSNQNWRNFMSHLAEHIAGLNSDSYAPVTVFEMWNEFSRSTESWTGTIAQMQRLVQDAACILKGSGPVVATGESCTARNLLVPAVAVLPGVALVSPSAQAAAPDIQTLGQYLVHLGTTLDAIAVHDYTYGDSCCARAETLIAHWNNLRTTLTSASANLPVWSTEGSWGDTASKEPDRDLQSAYVARAHLLGWSLGFQRLYWYAWGNSWGRLWTQSGINGCRDGGSGAGCKSPAAFAYATVYSWMVGNILTRACASSGSVFSCEFTRPDGLKTLAVWDAAQSCTQGSCGTSYFAVPPGYTSYFDLANVRHAVRGNTVRIGAKPILLIAGRAAQSQGRQNPLPSQQAGPRSGTKQKTISSW
ncbi:MAG: hypothetical protein JST79_15825 [Acidobacteria bacterium]|nr:hypothetical protein [Acidobacteriota bacterium]